MQTRKLEQSSLLVGAIGWGAIASGVLVALALESVLGLLGLAFATSTGDRTPGSVFEVWAVLVQVCAIAVGAVLTARLAHATHQNSGVAAGVMTWAAAIAFGGLLHGALGTSGFDRVGVWLAFAGTVLSFGGAIAAGAFATTFGAQPTDASSLPPPPATPPAIDPSIGPSGTAVGVHAVH